MPVAIMQADELERQRTAERTKALEEQAPRSPSTPARQPRPRPAKRRVAGCPRAHAAGRAGLGRQQRG